MKSQWNVTPLIRRGSNFYFFAALYFAQLDLLPCLQARGKRDCNKSSESNKKLLPGYLYYFVNPRLICPKLEPVQRAHSCLRLTFFHFFQLSSLAIIVVLLKKYENFQDLLKTETSQTQSQLFRVISEYYKQSPIKQTYYLSKQISTKEGSGKNKFFNLQTVLVPLSCRS